MLPTATYLQRRERIESYFDRTAADAWARLTSDAPVSGIRATVRAGRAEMRRTLLSWLPTDLRGKRVLDAGCGTGALAVEVARRGAQVTAIDLSPTLVKLAQERLPHDIGYGHIDFRVGDFLDPALGHFDHVVAMDSLIHYDETDVQRALTGLAQRTSTSIVFTFAPRTPLLTLMHAIGRAFPRGDRAPAIEPVAAERLRASLGCQPDLAGWHPARAQRIVRGFYISHGMELERR
ncbi:MAG: magnesium protoporphyrin IX methyltransferase [Betaproteobacteria bacterium]